MGCPLVDVGEIVLFVEGVELGGVETGTDGGFWEGSFWVWFDY